MSFNVVSGWAIHEWRQLRGVLITVDGRPKAFVTTFSERRDLARRWGSLPNADRAGWTATIDFGDTEGSEVVVSAYAFLEPRRQPVEGEPQRLGPVRHIGTVRCQVRSDEGPAGLPTGFFHESDFVTAGYVHVTGHIQSIEDVATVELRLDGESTGLARATPGEELRRQLRVDRQHALRGRGPRLAGRGVGVRDGGGHARPPASPSSSSRGTSTCTRSRSGAAPTRLG